MEDSGEDPYVKGPGYRREPFKSFRRWASSDDLLSGFAAKESSQPEIRAFFVSTIVATLVAWDVAFDLGAYHTVFFDKRHQLAVVLFVVVLGTLTVRRQVRTNSSLLVFLSVPFLWLIFRLIFPVHDAGGLTETVESGFFVAIVLLYPVASWIVLRLMLPDYFQIPHRRLKVASIAIVLTVGALGYLVGEFNSRFLSCEEFAVSGNDLPADCADR